MGDDLLAGHTGIDALLAAGRRTLAARLSGGLDLEAGRTVLFSSAPGGVRVQRRHGPRPFPADLRGLDGRHRIGHRGCHPAWAGPSDGGRPSAAWAARCPRRGRTRGPADGRGSLVGFLGKFAAGWRHACTRGPQTRGDPAPAAPDSPCPGLEGAHRADRPAGGRPVVPAASAQRLGTRNHARSGSSPRSLRTRPDYAAARTGFRGDAPGAASCDQLVQGTDGGAGIQVRGAVDQRGRRPALPRRPCCARRKCSTGM